MSCKSGESQSSESAAPPNSGNYFDYVVGFVKATYFRKIFFTLKQLHKITLFRDLY